MRKVYYVATTQVGRHEVLDVGVLCGVQRRGVCSWSSARRSAEWEVLRPGLKGLLLELGTALDRAGGVVAGSQGPKVSLLELSLALGGLRGARRGPKGDR